MAAWESNQSNLGSSLKKKKIFAHFLLSEMETNSMAEHLFEASGALLQARVSWQSSNDFSG